MIKQKLFLVYDWSCSQINSLALAWSLDSTSLILTPIWAFSATLKSLLASLDFVSTKLALAIESFFCAHTHTHILLGINCDKLSWLIKLVVGWYTCVCVCIYDEKMVWGSFLQPTHGWEKGDELAADSFIQALSRRAFFVSTVIVWMMREIISLLSFSVLGLKGAPSFYSFHSLI